MPSHTSAKRDAQFATAPAGISKERSKKILRELLLYSF